MRLRVLHGQGSYLLRDQAHQPLVQAETHLADGLLAQAHGRGEDQVGPVGLQQVRRADVAAEPRRNQAYDTRQDGRGIAAGVDQRVHFVNREACHVVRA